MEKKLFRSMSIVLFICLCFLPSHMAWAEEIQSETVQTEVVEQVVTDEASLIQPIEQLTAEQQAEIQIQQQIAAVTEAQQSRQLVIIGDSRTVGMKSAVGKNNNLWSAKVGMGLSWMKNTGVPAVETNINANSDVVILMGVNDVRSLSYTKKYISYLNDKAAEWTALGANVYYVSVNPMVFESDAYAGINNDLISAWNAKMQAGLSSDISYIDTYSQVLGKLGSRDGIHYNNKSYKLIYELINQGIINDKVMKEYYSI